MTFSWNKKPAIAVAPSPVTAFDYLGAEKAFLAVCNLRVIGTSLVVSERGKVRPLRDREIEKFLRSHLIGTDQMKFWRRDLADDFLAFVRAGL